MATFPRMFHHLLMSKINLVSKQGFEQGKRMWTCIGYKRHPHIPLMQSNMRNITENTQSKCAQDSDQVLIMLNSQRKSCWFQTTCPQCFCCGQQYIREEAFISSTNQPIPMQNYNMASEFTCAWTANILHTAGARLVCTFSDGS